MKQDIVEKIMKVYESYAEKANEMALTSEQVATLHALNDVMRIIVNRYPHIKD